MVKIITVYTGTWLKGGYYAIESPRIAFPGDRPLYNIFGFLLKEAGLSDDDLLKLPLDQAWEKAKYLLPAYDQTLVDLVQMFNDMKNIGEAEREKLLRYVFSRWHITIVFTVGSPADWRSIGS